jgi:hypothetical protein
VVAHEIPEHLYGLRYLCFFVCFLIKRFRYGGPAATYRLEFLTARIVVRNKEVLNLAQ